MVQYLIPNTTKTKKKTKGQRSSYSDRRLMIFYVHFRREKRPVTLLPTSLKKQDPHCHFPTNCQLSPIGERLFLFNSLQWEARGPIRQELLISWIHESNTVGALDNKCLRQEVSPFAITEMWDVYLILIVLRIKQHALSWTLFIFNGGVTDC
jgi:hypothetical protein